MADTMHEVQTRDPPSVRQRRGFVRMGVVAVVAVALMVTLAAVVIFVHRPHTPQITPGQKQPSAVVALLTGRIS